MSDGPDKPAPELFLALAECVMEVLRDHGLDALVIGGYALAAHNYKRATDDLDLGVSTRVAKLRTLRDALEQQGYTATLRAPDGNDPLGGVIDIEDGSGALVQVVNFDNSPARGFPCAIEDALRDATPYSDTTKLRAIPLPQLIALKLYAGGPQSRADILALLRANPDADVDAIRELCRKYRLPVAVLDDAAAQARS